MSGLSRRTGELYEQSEHLLGRAWPVWVAALVFYSGAAFVLLTRVRLPTPLHLITYLMAVIVLVLTFIRIEWAVMGLALMIPFARPGFTLGAAKSFHVSGFNMAVLGVWVVHTLQYLMQKGEERRNPFIRLTGIDVIIALFLFLVVMATLSGLSNMGDAFTSGQIALFLKEAVFYFAWLYLVHTILRTPTDLRRFALFLGESGILVAVIGLATRMQSASASLGVSEAELEGGVIGGRTSGGWLGLIHPNLYGAFLLVSLPIWFFAVDHLRKASHRLFVQAAVLVGFVGLLFTYSRSAWGGALAGLGSQIALRPQILRRMALFIVMFTVVAQVLAISMTGQGFVELIQIRFEQLQRSQFSSRPAIYASAMEVLRSHPLLGVGGGAFSYYAAGAWEGGKLLHAHNVFLTYACELGLPAASVFVLLMAVSVGLAFRNLRRLVNTPGYGFLAQATLAGMIGLMVQFMFDNLFMSRDVGYAIYGTVAIILGLNRFYNEGALPPPAAGMPGEPAGAPDRVWRGS